jgi:hypothetical protein
MEYRTTPRDDQSCGRDLVRGFEKDLGAKLQGGIAVRKIERRGQLPV